MRGNYIVPKSESPPLRASKYKKLHGGWRGDHPSIRVEGTIQRSEDRRDVPVTLPKLKFMDDV